MSNPETDETTIFVGNYLGKLAEVFWEVVGRLLEVWGEVFGSFSGGCPEALGGEKHVRIQTTQ